MPPAARTRRASARAFRPSPTATCTSATPRASASTSAWRADYGGVCHLRFDDTNPEKEEQEYVDAIIDAVQWLGFDWRRQRHQPPLLRQRLLRLHVPRRRDADRSRPRLRRRAERRGDARQPRRLQHARHRQPVPRPHAGREPGALSRDARRQACRRRRWCCARRSTWRRPTSTCATRRSTASSAPTHHNTGDTWCIYPMYTYAHPIEDALENITHSICTLEFEDQRPFYDWLLDTPGRRRPARAARCPQQYEFARLNLTYVITSKRKLQAAGRREASSTAGTTRACPRSPACAGAATRPRAIRTDGRAHRRRPRPAAGSTTSALEIALRDDLEAQGAARDGGARPGEARSSPTGPRCSAAPRTASRAARRRIRTGPSCGSAQLHARPRGVDRARRLRRGAAEGLLPPASPATRCA